jgi:V/A-type H+-transporting ATPase subunit E
LRTFETKPARVQRRSARRPRPRRKKYSPRRKQTPSSSEIEQEREQALSSATLEAKQERLGARRDVLEDVYDAVEESIADVDGDRRRELTEALLEATLAEFDDETVTVSTRAADVDLLESLLEGRNAEVGEPVDCLGGVVAESDASRVRVNNTFDSILESVWDDELKQVSERLFDQ